MRDLRIVFMGTPGFAVGVLKTLIENNCTIVGVITAPDKPAGRGRKLVSSALKQYAISQNLPVLQPTNLKNEAFLHLLKDLNANLQIVVAFRMLPKVVWSLPDFGTFNLHASLLPNYRGAAPINWAIINQEQKTGVTTFFIDEKIDTGAIIAQKEITISPRETAGSLHDTLMKLGSQLVLETVQGIAKNTIISKTQSKTDVFKEAPKLDAKNTKIDWLQPVKNIDALIRGLSPYPVAWTELYQENETYKVKIYEASFVETETSEPQGAIIASKSELKVAAKDGYLIIEELQLPGKKRMRTKDLLNGFTFHSLAQIL